jgi:hypothetical protein
MGKARKVGKPKAPAPPTPKPKPKVEIVEAEVISDAYRDVVEVKPESKRRKTPHFQGGKVTEGTRKRQPPSPQKTRKSSATYANDPDEPDRCHAAAKSTGKRCGKPSARGMQVCRIHGGKSPGGPIIHGGYSRVLAAKLSAIYEDGRENEQMLFDMTETLALSHVVLTRSIERAQAADVPFFRKRSKDLLDEALELGAESDLKGMGAKLQELRKLLASGVREDGALRHMQEAIEQMAKHKKESWEVRLKAAHALNERDLVLVSARFIDIAITTLGAKDAARLAQAIDREGF